MYTYQITEIPLNINDSTLVTIGVSLLSNDGINPTEDEKQYSLPADQATPENFHALIQADIDKLNVAVEAQAVLAKAFSQADTPTAASIDTLAGVEPVTTPPIQAI